ncbi:hypothetical protein EYF80_009204 [Liparis tanakae]|uniref:Uncharacterized protein n=1 Tax=Liparis tanakae TaxID=230148 RepID=A0A4Z2IRA7_9TELE|nr:hypothetical protein EYF80_009204 [Liparis tanakae]
MKEPERKNVVIEPSSAQSSRRITELRFRVLPRAAGGSQSSGSRPLALSVSQASRSLSPPGLQTLKCWMMTARVGNLSAGTSLSISGDFLSQSMNHEGAVGCSDAPGEQLGVQCLAQGHFNGQLMGRAGIEPKTLGLQDDP